MGVTLNEIVPWGRSFSEYQKMFDLTDSDLEERILGCADGPASFNAGLTAQVGTVVSVDPLYSFLKKEFRIESPRYLRPFLRKPVKRPRIYMDHHSLRDPAGRNPQVGDGGVLVRIIPGGLKMVDISTAHFQSFLLKRGIRNCRMFPLPVTLQSPTFSRFPSPVDSRTLSGRPGSESFPPFRIGSRPLPASGSCHRMLYARRVSSLS